MLAAPQPCTSPTLKPEPDALPIYTLTLGLPTCTWGESSSSVSVRFLIARLPRLTRRGSVDQVPALAPASVS